MVFQGSVRTLARRRAERGIILIEPEQRMSIEKDQRPASHSSSIGARISPTIEICPLWAPTKVVG